MHGRRSILLLAAMLACESTPEPRPPVPGQVARDATVPEVEPAPAPARPAESVGPADFASLYASMMQELADNIVRRTEEASKHDYDNLEDAKAALDEALPKNSLGQLDAVLAEAGVDKKTMAAFMRDNPEVVEQVAKDFEARLAKAEPALAALVAKVEALQLEQSGG